MSARFEIPARTREQQELVSNPAASAWVSANAGSGKTTVLVRRVIRLLLAGNPPARILCLTFTKAAAANMANKVLDTLSKWVRLDDDALDAAIREVSPLPPTPALRAAARRLFAQALETPGGLKVQTIHAFCDRVLHQFPIEARVPAGFEVLDEMREFDLLDRARQSVLVEAANHPQGKFGHALARAVEAASDTSLEEALQQAVRQRRRIARLIETGGDARIAEALGLDAAETVAAIERTILNGPNLPQSEWTAAANSLAVLGGNAKKCGDQLASAAGESDAKLRVQLYLAAYFTKEGNPREDKGFGAAAARAAEPRLFARLFAERDRLPPLCEKLRAAEARERTGALLTLAQAVIERFEAGKRARGALDYSDLIDRTVDMFADRGSAWVLYKLDGGIDHVLIDEAQDTSPEQWQVIARLTEEFFAGRGAREWRGRTVFAVGDEKQSIFSFQGADPRQFEEMRKMFAVRIKESGADFHFESLRLSFRSAGGVLEAIDKVFERPEAHRGLSVGDEGRTTHEAIRDRAPALVEIWPTEEPETDDDEELAWDAPLNARSESSPVVRLAQKIAAAVTHWLAGGLAVGDGERRRTPRAGDVIVLVRRRGPLFEAVLQALKRAGVPVAGADRLHLTEHIGVMDLMALGDALLLEDDDFSLACALKSPLFGLDEDDLFALAHGRPGTLAAALAANPRFAAAAETLARWRAEALALPPFDFYSRVLGRDGGRAKMLARLGPEAADALDEFLAHALAFEGAETASLPGFLDFLRRAGTEVKRDLEVESDAVRVMTVHGAKGLEAPIVILADTTSMPDGRHDDRLLELPGSEAFVWAAKKETDSARMREARAAAAERREAEYRRLLYVALTRAADALIVCGHEGSHALKEGCWYRLVETALEDGLKEGPAPGFAGTVRRWREPQDAPAVAAERAAPAPVVLPGWLETAKPMRSLPIARRADATTDVTKGASRGGGIDPRRRGELVHRLIQHLPGIEADAREAAAARFLAQSADDLPAAMQADIAEAVRAILQHPELEPLFGPQSRAEVEIASRIPGIGPRRIDRLAVLAEGVLFADFKTGRAPAPGAPVPQAYLEQLARYRAALARIYPGRAMRALLVWIDGAKVQEIPESALDPAAAGTGTGSPPRETP